MDRKQFFGSLFGGAAAAVLPKEKRLKGEIGIIGEPITFFQSKSPQKAGKGDVWIDASSKDNKAYTCHSSYSSLSMVDKKAWTLEKY